MPFQLVLNYRRGDAAGNAGRLHEALAARFGEDNVFMDIDTIEPGVDFVEAIERAVGSCDVFLAMIGQHWLTAADQWGQRRLDQPDDFVRLEIEAALRRGIRVIPVLVQDVEMPSADQLPQSLAKFARRNGIEIRDSTWRYDVDRLIETLTKIEQQQPLEPGELGGTGSPIKQRRPSRRLADLGRVPLAAAVVALLIGAALLAVLLLRNGDDPEPPADGEPGATESWDRLVFAANERIFTVDVDGSDEFDPTQSRGSGLRPAWSPDGTRLAVARAGEIVLLDASGRQVGEVTSGAEDNAPDWSPDGTRIAFDRRKERPTTVTHDVWVVNVDGTQEQNLTEDTSGAAPSWSGDGTRIVFQRRQALWWMPADGSGPEQRLPLELRGSLHEPDWSPRSNEVVFAHVTNRGTDIYLYVVDPPGRAPVNLTSGRVTTPAFPAWSSDGEQIVFAAEDGIYTMNRDGGALNRVARGQDLESPSLRPPRG